MRHFLFALSIVAVGLSQFGNNLSAQESIKLKNRFKRDFKPLFAIESPMSVAVTDLEVEIEGDRFVRKASTEIIQIPRHVLVEKLPTANPLPKVGPTGPELKDKGFDQTPPASKVMDPKFSVKGSKAEQARKYVGSIVFQVGTDVLGDLRDLVFRPDKTIYVFENTKHELQVYSPEDKKFSLLEIKEGKEEALRKALKKNADAEDGDVIKPEDIFVLSENGDLKDSKGEVIGNVDEIAKNKKLDAILEADRKRGSNEKSAPTSAGDASSPKSDGNSKDMYKPDDDK